MDSPASLVGNASFLRVSFIELLNFFNRVLWQTCLAEDLWKCYVLRPLRRGETSINHFVGTTIFTAEVVATKLAGSCRSRQAVLQAY